MLQSSNRYHISEINELEQK